MNTQIKDFPSVEEQRERQLRTMTAEELHLCLVEDLRNTKDLETSLVTARQIEAQTQQILNELISEAGGAVVYFPAIEVGCGGFLLTVKAGKGYQAQRIVLNPRFVTAVSADIVAAVTADEEASKRFRKISREEADRRRESKKGGLQGDVTTC